MQTTEIFIEQVLIGFLVFAIGALPFSDRIVSFIGDEHSVGHALFFGAALVGAAYLCGVVFDKYADACLERFAGHIRAVLAIKYATHDGKFVVSKSDPFPEDQYRIEQLRAESGVVEWFHYLRSTIRLSRALSVYGPGLTLGGVMAIASDLAGAWLPWSGYLLIVLCYLGLPLFSFGGKAPKTHETEPLKVYAESRALIPEHETSPQGNKKPKEKRWVIRPADVFLTPQFAGAAVLIGVALILAVADVCRKPAGDPGATIAPIIAAIGGGAFTCLAAWAWAKMERTFMNYHHLFHLHHSTAAR